MSVTWQKVQIPLAAGMQNRTNDQALEPPALEVCKNADFTELGGIRKRKAFAWFASDPGAGLRRVEEYDGEILAFTADGIYSYGTVEGDLMARGTYLAAVVEEQPRFVRTTEQSVAERAELNGVAVVAWVDEGSSTFVKFSAFDTSTGAVMLSERTLASGTTRPRLVAMDTKIILLYADGANLRALLLNPDSAAELASSADATPGTITGAFGGALDAVKYDFDEIVLAYRTSGGLLTVRRINESLTSTYSNATARTVTSCVAVAVSPGGLVVVARNSGTNIRGDLLSATLADSTVDVALGTGTTTINQVAACFKSVQDSGQYRCQVYWSSNEDSSPSASNFECEANYLDDAGSAGTASTLAHRLGVASRAFEYSVGGVSRVLVWLAFGSGGTTAGATFSQLQNGYFLYDPDGGIHAKAIPATGGGFSQIQGHLPSVQALSSTRYACALVERRSVAIGEDDTEFAQRTPREVIVSLDDNRARRVARLGATLYISGSLVSQFDGVSVHELGFPVAPYYCDALSVGSGSIPDGTYTYKVSARWENAKGELERSTSYGADSEAMASGGSTGQISVAPVHVTTKLDPAPAVEVWRTAVDPVLDSPFYLTTSKDPTDTGDNGYLENDPTVGILSTYGDDLEDGPLDTPAGADYLTRHETFYENGGVLANLAPPSATIIAAGADRLYLAGIPGRPYRVSYSKLRGDGELAQFNDALFIDVPSDSGAITALAFVNDTLVAFCERGIYALLGSGYDNVGGGQNYTPRLLSTDVGAVSADAVGVTPDGAFFHSSKGWHLLDRGFGVRYIGAPVADFDSYTFADVAVARTEHQIRCMGYSGSDAVVLVFDTVAEQWSEWEIADTDVHATQWGTEYVVVGADVRKQATAHGTGTYDYSLDLETAWIKLDGLQGFRRIRRLLVLGEYQGAHRLRVRIAYDYVDSWVDDFYWTVSPTTVGDREQVETRPSRPKGQAIKIRITDRHVSTDTPPGNDSVKLSGLALEVGVKRGTYRALPAAQKQ